MMKSHQLRHAVLGKINFCFFLKKNGKIFFAEGKHGKIFFAFFLEKIKNGKNMFCRRKKWKHIFVCIFLISDKIKTGFFLPPKLFALFWLGAAPKLWVITCYCSKHWSQKSVFREDAHTATASRYFQILCSPLDFGTLLAPHSL